MSYFFIQVTARKDSDNFAMCSNLSLMDHQGMTPEQAEKELERMASEYSAKGYTIEWTREEMAGVDLEMWAPLFEQATACV